MDPRARTYSTSPDPSLAVAVETDAEPFWETFWATVLSQKLTIWIKHCWNKLHQPHPKLPSTTNNYQVFFCCTKTTMSVSPSSPEPPSFISPPPTSFLFLPVFSSLNNILSLTHTHIKTHTVRQLISGLPVETNKDCDMAFRHSHSQYYLLSMLQGIKIEP